MSLLLDQPRGAMGAATAMGRAVRLSLLLGSLLAGGTACGDPCADLQDVCERCSDPNQRAACERSVDEDPDEVCEQNLDAYGRICE